MSDIKPVAYLVQWGGSPARNNSVHLERETADAVAESIGATAEVRDLHAASDIAALVGQARDALGSVNNVAELNECNRRQVGRALAALDAFLAQQEGPTQPAASPDV